MSRHTEAHNLVLYTVAVKLRCSVATVAVKDKQPLSSYYTRLYIAIKVL